MKEQKEKSEIKQKTIPFSKLSMSQAIQWLLNNDPDGSEIYQEISRKKDAIDTVRDNINSFGLLRQSGSIIISSNNDDFLRADLYPSR